MAFRTIPSTESFLIPVVFSGFAPLRDFPDSMATALQISARPKGFRKPMSMTFFKVAQVITG
jgi:hypothetical protein